MKFEDYVIKKSDGTEEAVKITLPETLEELVKLDGEAPTFSVGLSHYKKRMKKRLVSQRSAKLTLRLNDLTAEQIVLLRKHGFLKK